MQYLNKKVICKSVFISLLIIFTMVLRLPWIVNKFEYVYISNSLMYALIYFGLFIAWGTSINRRIIQKEVLKLLLIIVALLLFWFMVRTIKYIYIENNYTIERWIWYSYYIPMLFIPLISIFVALSLGKTEDYKLPKWAIAVCIPTIFLLGFVLTNDFHQLVFKFPKDTIWASSDYQYGGLYWIVWLWIVLPLLISLIIIILKSRSPHSKKILYFPFAPYILGLIYGFLYIMKIPILRIVAGDMTAIFSLFTMAIFESLIQSGLIRSNIYYEELFYSSELNIKIANKDCQICYETDSKSIEANSDTRTSVFPIVGGQVYWMEDISKVKRIIKELEEINQRLSENNNLLQAELELRERKIKVDEKIRLYNNIIKKVAPQLKLLNNILSVDYKNTSLSKEKMVEVCVLGTYIKRQSNLLILKEDRNIFSSREIVYCLKESIEAISQGEIMSSLKASCEGNISAINAILIYDLFEEIVESIFPSLKALFINLSISKKDIDIKFQINGDEESLLKNKIDKVNFKSIHLLIKRGGQIEMSDEDGNLAISIKLPKAGEAI